MTSSIKGLPLTFYGHFSGYSSYPVVCRALARWLLSRGADLRVCNLRDDPVPDWLGRHEVDPSFRAAVWNRAVASFVCADLDLPPDRPEAIGLLFGFPEWLPSMPEHRTMVGYHVPDLRPAPPRWKKLIEDACDVVLTPSSWCADLLDDLDLTRQGKRIPIHVVPHGVDPVVFRPGDSPRPPEYVGGRRKISLRHFCSSPQLERKGTLPLLAAARDLFQSPPWDSSSVYVSLIASVNDEAITPCAPYSGEYTGGAIGVFPERAGAQRRIAKVLRQIDFLLQPSRAEGFGCIPLESVACGTPVLLVGQTGEAEYLDDLEDAALRVCSTSFDWCLNGEAPRLGEAQVRQAVTEAVATVDERRRAARLRSPEVRQRWSWDAVLDRALLPVLFDLL